MYCVIQEVQLKKPNAYGEHKIIEAYSPFALNGKPTYSYRHIGGRFERPIKTAYKISIHESKRINGVVTKKQYAVTTVDYYCLATDWFALGDCEKKISAIAEKLNVDDVGKIYDIIDAKLEPLEKLIKIEYQKTEEYKTHVKHEKILETYRKAKAKFAKTYSCSENEYDYIFNVFGELMNNEYYEKIINDYKSKRSYQEKNYSNYNNFNGGSSQNNNDGSGYNLFGSKSTAYTEDEKSMLKNFYKTLSKTYHPDVVKGSGKEMQLINKLKEAWDI